MSFKKTVTIPLVEVEQLRAIVNAGTNDWDVLHEHHKTIVQAVREADADFRRLGGGSRHWVRECFWPRLRDYGLVVVPIGCLEALLGELKRLVEKDDQ